MIAFDTNILVYAYDEASAHHEPCYELLMSYWSGQADWALAWPSLYEFLRILTHPKVLAKPRRATQAVAIIDEILDCPTLSVLTHRSNHWDLARVAAKRINPIANAAFDIQIAAILLENGVTSIYTRDKAFVQLGLTVIDPFRT